MMKTYRKPLADDEDMGDDDQLLALQRMYHAAEIDRKAYSDETQSTLRKQTQLIEKLQKDNANLHEKVGEAEGEAADDHKVQQRLQNLKDQCTGYTASMGQEKDTTTDLEKAIRGAERKLKSRSVEIAKSAQSSGSQTVSTQKRITTMENRLEQASKKFNDTLAGNAKLRETIDNLKAERKQFDTLYGKLDRKLQAQKRECSAIVESSNAAYEARDEAQAKMNALKEKNEKEMAQYNMEIKELNRVLEHDRKLKSFMSVKGQERAGKGMGATKSKSAFSEDNPEATVQSYEEAFSKIKEATGIDDINKLVDRFVAVGDENFALFNYVNELNTEIEGLRDKITEVKANIERFNQQGQAMDQQRKKALKEFQDKLAATEAEAAAYAEKQTNTQEELESLKTGIDQLFNKIGCDKSGIAAMLGSSGVSETNIMQYLGVIEQRANELLHIQTSLEAKATQEWEKKESELREQVEDDKGFDPTATLGPKPQPNSLLGTGPQPRLRAIGIQPPSTIDDLESDDDLSDSEMGRPLSKAELQAKIAKSMSKAAKKGSGRKR